MRKSNTLIAVLLLLCAVTAARAQVAGQWQKFEPAGEGFTVQLPTAPLSETRVSPANQRMKMRIHKSETEALSFYIASLDYSGLFPQSAAGFDSFAKGFLNSYCEPARKQGLTCEVTFQRELALGGSPGKQYGVALSGNGRRIDGVLRMYMTASHVYAFHALGGKEGDAPIDKFLNSFAIAAGGRARS
jgi:hypothetical protein